jgi:hypothetical protein
MLLTSGKVLTIYTTQPLSKGLCEQIREEVGGDFLDAKVQTLEEHRRDGVPNA